MMMTDDDDDDDDDYNDYNDNDNDDDDDDEDDDHDHDNKQQHRRARSFKRHSKSPFIKIISWLILCYNGQITTGHEWTWNEDG